ncbi:hypothetical protein O181_022434 [Austropuccinia psidii MF-1]|uniref:Uncharacterized protein n=1 Tax=Austropuccinia psidii MF-1 TaxID=1389203 RepID=A0A9Q3CER9_9BASI|nr:hypothetical protein [Austropuccinia psidii MF-1]
MANLSIFSILSHLNPHGMEWPPGHILHHWPPWPILNPTNPQANTSILGLGWTLSLPGASGPSSHMEGLWTTPFYLEVWGISGRFGPFRPPMASTVCSPYAMGQIRPHLGQL